MRLYRAKIREETRGADEAIQGFNEIQDRLWMSSVQSCKPYETVRASNDSKWGGANKFGSV